MNWIKLVIHSKHPKILHIAEATQTDARLVVGAIVEWFHWVDEHANNDTSIGRAGFRAVTGWPEDALADAMMQPEVDWLEATESGRLRPTRLDAHFSQSAKQRAATAKRMASARRTGSEDVRKMCAPVVTKSAPRGEKEKKKDQAPSPAREPEAEPNPEPGDEASDRSGALVTGAADGEIPGWWAAVKTTLDGWSNACRGRAMSAEHNESQSILAALRARSTGPPIAGAAPHTHFEAIARRLWTKGAGWKSTKYVIGCLNSEITDWSSHGLPSDNKANRSASFRAREPAEERRRARRSGEFAEDLVLPIVTGRSADGDEGADARGSGPAERQTPV